jgi:ligand-binding sensor domain-containing protein
MEDAVHHSGFLLAKAAKELQATTVLFLLLVNKPTPLHCMRIVAAIFVFLTQGYLHAQTFQSVTYTTKDGLSSNNISFALKDDKGFLWLASNNGLNRFDGNAVDHFFNNPADSTSIASNEIHNLFIDSKKRLWVTTMAGLSLYHPFTQTFSNYAPDTNIISKIGSSYPGIEEDGKGNIWIGCSYGLLIFNPVTKKFSNSGWAAFADKVKPAIANHSRVVVLCIKAKTDKEFWLMTTYGLFSVHTETTEFRYYPYAGIKDYYGCQLNYIDDQGQLWIGTYNHGIVSYNPLTDQWAEHKTPVGKMLHPNWDWAYGITRFNGDTLLYCSQKEPVFIKKTETGSVVIDDSSLTHIFPRKGFLNFIKEGNCFWLLSYDGITKVFPSRKIFSLKAADQFQYTGQINLLAGNENSIAVSDITRTGVLYNMQTKQVITIKDDTGKPLTGNLVALKKITGDDYLLTTNKALYRYNERTNTASSIALPAKIYSNNPYALRSIESDKNTTWIRDRLQGILEYDNATGNIRYLTIGRGSETPTYSSMLYDSIQQELWIGMENNGVYIYNTLSKSISHHRFNIPPSQKGSTFTAIAKGDHKTIYAAEYNYGLLVINTASKKIQRYSSYDGLASNTCNFLCKDNGGNIWLSTTEGLSRFDTATKSFSNFPELKEATVYAAFMNAGENGNMFIAAPRGFYTWNADNFIATKATGKLYTRNVTMGDKQIGIDSTFQFSHEDNNLSFQFGYRSFDSEEKPVLLYRLNNGEWLPLNDENKVSFSNLSPNQYILTVREKNDHSQMLSLGFIIQPPFYKTWWFLLLATILAALIIFYLFRRRIQSVKKQAALKQKVAETEMMALRAQMNPHFIFNCISSIDNFILDNDKDNASNYLNKFAKLIRNILDNSKNEVVPFWKDWETLKLYLELEQLRSNNKFICTMQADEELLNGHYKIPPLIIQPYIENAIHHGLNPLTERKGELFLKAEIKDTELVFTINDNGVGRKKAAEKNSVSPSHQSYGMQLTKERIHLFNEEKGNDIVIKDLADENGNATGTEVTVLLHI